jgi:hypothetical protein
MRTPEQIKNLKRVMFSIIGPAAALYTDEMVDGWADSVQDSVNRVGVKVRWILRVRTEQDKGKPWKHIDPEPGLTRATEEAMRKVCEQLLERHPGILEVSVQEEPNATLTVRTFIVKREDCSQS